MRLRACNAQIDICRPQYSNLWAVSQSVNPVMGAFVFSGSRSCLILLLFRAVFTGVVSIGYYLCGELQCCCRCFMCVMSYYS